MKYERQQCSWPLFIKTQWDRAVNTLQGMRVIIFFVICLDKRANKCTGTPIGQAITYMVKVYVCVLCFLSCI